jgi:valyl-tRNA synthetase
MSEFAKKYEPENFEKSIYKNWEQDKCFEPKKSITGDTYYLPIPPPNVTGILHLGHAIMLTIEDVMVRYHRMKGDATLWVPWTDHAWIATQAKVEEKLAKEGKKKEDIGREKFIEACWDWTNKYGWGIKDQIRMMGSSVDWSKDRFTLDSELNRRVNKAFVDLYKKGLIYRGEYMVNYSPGLQTVLSDAEVEYKEEKGKLYYITYFVSGSDSEIVVATTRPETMLGDVAVAVNPKDKRYKKILKAGKKLILPILNKEIPLIGDEMVDMEFGTGAVKITPAHDPNDFEVAQRHKLPLTEVVLWKDGKMTKLAGIFAGQDFVTARQNVVELLKSKGNLLKIEDYTNRVGYCSRSGTKVETIISKQWFVKVQPLADKVIHGYKKNEFEIIPERFNKTFEDWMYNLRDWCISRQLWWGHQIPIWYTDDGKELCAETQEEAQKLAGAGVNITQDADVLDTWFSSALWPFSILDYDMWGGEQPDLVKQFYPAQMLETGHDILFFWVIRMLLFWYEFTGETPFKQVYLHGLVRDKNGRKMSKSLGNGIDPLDMIAKYGTDPLRLALSIGNTPGNDLRFDEEVVENNRLFLNKLWNACRFVYTNVEKEIPTLWNLTHTEKVLKDNYESLMVHEKWILSRIKYLSDLVGESMEKNNFSIAGEELQTFTKNEFCDYYIEEFKVTRNTSPFGKYVIVYTIVHLLKLWHPYIPFVTEALWKSLWLEWNLMESNWSQVGIARNEEIEKEKIIIIDLVREIRRLKAESNVPNSGSIKLYIYYKGKNLSGLEASLDIIWGIVKSEHTEILDKKPKDDNLVYSVIKAGVEVYIDISNAIDNTKEIERLKESITDTKEYIALLDRKLLNESFVRKAPQSLVREEMEKKKQAEDKLAMLEEKLQKLRS